MTIGSVARASLALGFVVSIGSVALAGDDKPPYWRGSSNSFHGVWGFPDDITPDAPELGAFNPAIEGVATMTALTSERGGPEWFADFEGHDGAWRVPTNAGLAFDIPNYESENPLKWIRIQIKYYNPSTEPGGFGRGDDILVAPLLADGEPGDFEINKFAPFLVPVDNEPGWYSVVWDFSVFPSPAFEAISLINGKNSDIYFDQVVIDTWSVTNLPAAPSLALLALCGLGATRRRRSSR